MKLDWQALRHQKRTLIGLADSSYIRDSVVNDLNALVHLIDAIQDCAVETGEATENEVFGELK